jgi:hypothetical protein
MIKQLENEIRDLKENSRRYKGSKLTFASNPAEGIQKSKRKMQNSMSWRASKKISDYVRDLTRKRQLLISESTTKGSYESPSCGDSP